MEKVKGRFDRRPAGFPVEIAWLSPLGSRASVQQAVSRLARKGRLVRLGHGVYARPGVSGELTALCSEAWDRWHALCLWNMPVKPRFLTTEECLMLARALRQNGGMKTWAVAMQIERRANA